MNLILHCLSVFVHFGCLSVLQSHINIFASSYEGVVVLEYCHRGVVLQPAQSRSELATALKMCRVLGKRFPVLKAACDVVS